MKIFFALAFLVSAAGFAATSDDQSGFKLTKLEHGSVYEKLGLKEGDILKTYNGKAFRDQKDLKQFAQTFSASKEKHIKLVIERSGKIQELDYNFAD